MFAHDIRNPLVGIKKTLELLEQDEGSQFAAHRQWWDDMRLTIDLLLGMINDMLDVYQESYSGMPLLTSPTWCSSSDPKPPRSESPLKSRCQMTMSR